MTTRDTNYSEATHRPLRTPKVLVVEHQTDAGIGFLGECLDRNNVATTIVGPVAGIEIPESGAGFDGVIVLGGSPGPTDDEAAPWLPRVRSLISSALEHELPLLGLCLGAELLAVVAGGTVSAMPAGSEKGLTDMTMTSHAAEDVLFSNLPVNVRGVQWHSLEISSLPPGTVSLCTSSSCANQAFRVGTNAWGLQFHPEVLTETTNKWVNDEYAGFAAAGRFPEGIVAEVKEAESELRRLWGGLADRWLQLVCENAQLSAPRTVTSGLSEHLQDSVG